MTAKDVSHLVKYPRLSLCSTLKKLAQGTFCLHGFITPPQVNDIAARAKAAQREWAKTSFNERRRVLSAMLAYIVEHMEDIARVCSRDSGKPSVYVGR